MVPELMSAGVRVVDLSADFRLKDLDVWANWYGMAHESPEWAEKAVYGLPEVVRDEIRTAQLVANPGCYPTAVQLGFIPLLEQGLVDPARLIADAKSGASGAGRQGKIGMLHGEVGESFKAYGASGHRHLPEIRQGLSGAAGGDVGVTFVPHLIPMIRGIEATLYAELKIRPILIGCRRCLRSVLPMSPLSMSCLSAAIRKPAVCAGRTSVVWHYTGRNRAIS